MAAVLGLIPYLLLLPTFVLAQEAPASESWVDVLLKGGPFAIALALVVMDRLTTPGERNRLRVENAELRAEIKELNQEVRHEIVPPLTEMLKLLPRLMALATRNRRDE